MRAGPKSSLHILKFTRVTALRRADAVAQLEFGLKSTLPPLPDL